MRVQLDRIGDEPYRWQEKRQISPAILERREVARLGDVTWEGTITKTGTGHLLQGKLEYQQTLTCQRCLVDSSEHVAVEVGLLLVPESDEPIEGEYELEAEDLDVHYVTDGTLDTEPILFEQLQLNVPMRPLCRDACAGLCPECGVDRNRETCDCLDPATDPRWSALRELRGLED